MKSPFGSTLPPGVTQADIDRAAGDDAECIDFAKWHDNGASTEDVRKLLDAFFEAGGDWNVFAWVMDADKVTPERAATALRRWRERMQELFEAMVEAGELKL